MSKVKVAITVAVLSIPCLIIYLTFHLFTFLMWVLGFLLNERNIVNNPIKAAHREYLDLDFTD